MGKADGPDLHYGGTHEDISMPPDRLQAADPRDPMHGGWTRSTSSTSKRCHNKGFLESCRRGSTTRSSSYVEAKHSTPSRSVCVCPGVCTHFVNIHCVIWEWFVDVDDNVQSRCTKLTGLREPRISFPRGTGLCPAWR